MEVVAERAAVLDYPSDLINVAIEHLAQERVELPAFSTLDRLTRRLRALVNRRYFTQITERLMEDDAAAGHPQRDALMEGRLSNGLPAQGFFLKLAELGIHPADPVAYVSETRTLLWRDARKF